MIRAVAVALALVSLALVPAAEAATRGTVAQRIARRLVPARVTRGEDGTITLVRHGSHLGVFQEIERIESGPTTIRRVAKQVVVRNGVEHDSTVASVTGRDGVTHTTTTTAGLPVVHGTVETGFHPLSYRRALFTAIADNPGTFVLQLAGASAAGMGVLAWVGGNLGSFPFAPEPHYFASMLKLSVAGGALFGGLGGLLSFPTEAPMSPRVGEVSRAAAP